MDIIVDDVIEGVKRLTLNRPEQLNAFRIETYAELIGILQRLKHDSSTRVVLLTGNGRAFCAGHDLRSSGVADWVDDPNLILDTVKRAEDSDALVLRLYEAHGARGVAHLSLRLPFESAVSANVLEDDGDELEVEDGAVVLPYRPHQLLTVKIA